MFSINLYIESHLSVSTFLAYNILYLYEYQYSNSLEFKYALRVLQNSSFIKNWIFVYLSFLEIEGSLEFHYL